MALLPLPAPPPGGTGRSAEGTAPPGSAGAGHTPSALAQLGGAHAVTCPDPAGPQLPDRVLGEARAQPGPEHAHVPWGPEGPGGAALSSRPVAPLSRGAAGGGAEGAAPAGSLHLRPAALPPSGRQGLACSVICWPRGDRAAEAEPRAGPSYATPPALSSRRPPAPGSWQSLAGHPAPAAASPRLPPASPGARRDRVARLSASASVLNAGRRRSTRRNVGALRHLPVRDEDREEESKIPGNHRLDGRC